MSVEQSVSLQSTSRSVVREARMQVRGERRANDAASGDEGDEEEEEEERLHRRQTNTQPRRRSHVVNIASNTPLPSFPPELKQQTKGTWSQKNLAQKAAAWLNQHAHLSATKELRLYNIRQFLQHHYHLLNTKWAKAQHSNTSIDSDTVQRFTKMVENYHKGKSKEQDDLSLVATSTTTTRTTTQTTTTTSATIAVSSLESVDNDGVRGVARNSLFDLPSIRRRTSTSSVSSHAPSPITPIRRVAGSSQPCLASCSSSTSESSSLRLKVSSLLLAPDSVHENVDRVRTNSKKRKSDTLSHFLPDSPLTKHLCLNVPDSLNSGMHNNVVTVADNFSLPDIEAPVVPLQYLEGEMDIEEDGTCSIRDVDSSIELKNTDRILHFNDTISIDDDAMDVDDVRIDQNIDSDIDTFDDVMDVEDTSVEVVSNASTVEVPPAPLFSRVSQWVRSFFWY